MKKIIFILSICLLSHLSNLQAQGLQPGECGIRFTYDATDSLTQREFICNNTGSVMYRTTVVKEVENDSIKVINANEIAKDEIVKVNAIMPNPTSGKFTIQLGKPLNNENVLLMDVNGKVIQNSKRSGSNLVFDIGSFSSGIYFVKIGSHGNIVSLKIIKQ